MDVNRVKFVNGIHCGVGYEKYRCVAREKESVEAAMASSGSEEVVNCGGLFDVMLFLRSERASTWDIIGVLVYVASGTSLWDENLKAAGASES